MKKACSNMIGSRHLRVGLELSGDGVRVTSLWLVEQPVVQIDRLSGAIAVRVDVPGLPPVVETRPDPRVVRGAYRDKQGHAFLQERTGALQVSVPFVHFDDLRAVRVRLMDLAAIDRRPGDRDGMLAAFDDPPGKCRVHELGTADLRAHPGWGVIPGTPGQAQTECSFEIVRDAKRGFRWRMLRFGVGVVAESSTSHPSREDCVQEVRWVRACAADGRVVSTDLRGAGDKRGEPTVKDTPSEPRDPDEDDDCK